MCTFFIELKCPHLLYPFKCFRVKQEMVKLFKEKFLVKSTKFREILNCSKDKHLKAEQLW